MNALDRYQLNAAKMFYDMADGQAIVINFETGMYYGMSSLGSAVLDALIAGNPAGEVLSSLKALKGCPGDIGDRLEEFLDALVKKDILRKAEQAAQAGESGPAIPEGALEEGFALTVNEYAEAADLILADPVHEVDVNMGWPIMKKP